MAISPDFKKKVIADLEKTGFPAEFQVRRTLAAHGARWDCTGTFPYFDEDEQKLRQLDIYAVMPCGDSVSYDKRTHTVWSLVIEVKKTDKSKPWIILKEKQHVIRDVMLWRQDLASFCNLPAQWEENFSWRIYQNSYCKNMKWRGFGVHESFTKPTESSRPYAAMISAIKAAEYCHKMNKAWMKDQKLVTDDITKNPSKVFFVRPVIVLDGDLLCAEADEAGKLQISEIDMAPIEVNYKSQNYERQAYRLDLVRLSALDSYLTFAENQHDAIRKAILELGGLGDFSEQEICEGAKPKKKRKPKTTKN